MKARKSVVVLSGGMDSVTLLHHLHATEMLVGAISFDYGQKHAKELACARWQAEQLGVAHKVIDLKFLGELVDSTLLDGGADLPLGHYEDVTMQATVVPNRNMIMASIAVAWGITLGADTVALGVHAGDHTVYPDCRTEFIATLNAAARLCDYHEIGVMAPFLDMKKRDILALGFPLGVDYGHTWTCYAGLDTPQKTGSSVERAEAFWQVGRPDPLYSPEDWAAMVQYLEQLQPPPL